MFHTKVVKKWKAYLTPSIYFPQVTHHYNSTKGIVTLSTQYNLLTKAWMYQLLTCPPTLHHLHNIKCYLSQIHNLDTKISQTWNSHSTVSAFYEMWKLPTTWISNTYSALNCIMSIYICYCHSHIQFWNIFKLCIAPDI